MLNEIPKTEGGEIMVKKYVIVQESDIEKEVRVLETTKRAEAEKEFFDTVNLVIQDFLESLVRDREGFEVCEGNEECIEEELEEKGYKNAMTLYAIYISSSRKTNYWYYLALVKVEE